MLYSKFLIELKMKNKKSEIEFTKIVGAVLALVVLFVIVGLFINGILVKKQAAFASSITDQVSQDCDEDDTLGFLDKCPCDPDIKKLSEGEECGPDSNQAMINCPALCKK